MPRHMFANVNEEADKLAAYRGREKMKRTREIFLIYESSFTGDSLMVEQAMRRTCPRSQLN